MLESRDLWSLLSLLVFIVFVPGGVYSAGPRQPGSVKSPSSTDLQTVTDGNEPISGVEYVNDGPLGILYDFLIQNRLQRLCILLRKADLESFLANAGSLTIFAPTDGSFAFLPGGTLEELENNPALLQEFLLHHFVSGDLPTSQITDEMVVDSLQGYPLKFNVFGSPQVITVSGAEIMQPDLEYELGRVHIIDRPLYPAPITDIMGYLQQYNSEFYNLIVAARLADFLSSGTYTILAPDDKAFDYLSLELKDALAGNESLAYDIVLLHVIPASVFVRGINDGMHINSVGGGDLEFTQRRGLTFVNGIPVVMPDIPATNGVIHVINRVLLPDGVDADCHCKPLDSSRVTPGSRTTGTAQRRPFEPSRLRTTPRPSVDVRPTPFATPPPIRSRTPSPRQPGVSSLPTRPGVGPQRPSTVPSRGQGIPSIPTPVGRPITPGTSVDRRPSATPSPVPPRRPVVPLRPGAGQRTPAPQATVTTQTPFSPGRIGQVPHQPSTSVERPGIPGVIVVDFQDDTEPEIVTHSRPDSRPRQPGSQLPGRRRPSVPGHQPGGPSQVSRPGFGVVPLDDNAVDNQGFPIQQEDYEPSDLTIERPTESTRFQPGRRPGQQTPFQPGQRPSQQPQFQPGQRPGDRRQFPSAITPGPQSSFQPSHRPGVQQPSPQPGRIPSQQVPQQPGRRPSPQTPFQPGQQPLQPTAPQPGRRPGQTTQFQPGRETGQFQPGRETGQEQPQPPQESSQQTPFQPSPIQPGRQPFQPTQRPGPRTPLQPPQRPGQPGQPSIFQPGQRQPPLQPGQQQPPFQPGQQQPPFQPGQQQPPPFQPGQQQPFQPSQRPGQPSRVPAPGPQQPSFQPSQRPGQPPRVPAPGPQVTARPRQQITTPRPLFPPQRPGSRPSHSMKGQPFDPQRRLQQNQRPPVQPIPGFVPRQSPVSPQRPSAVTTPSRQPIGSSRQTSTCRRRGERLTPATQSLPLCPAGDEISEPCQSVDSPYDPSDPRPPCQDISPCRIPGEPMGPGDTRPLCEGIQEQTDCRQPGQPFDPTDYRPLCPQSEQPSDCRQPQERPVPGDRRPICTRPPPTAGTPSQRLQPGQRPGIPQPPPLPRGTPPPTGTQYPPQQRPSSSRPLQPPGRQPVPPPTTPGTMSSCRQPNERPVLGDRRPLCVSPQTQPPQIPSTLPQQRRPGGASTSISGRTPQKPGKQSKINCRQVGERPTPGDSRPLCSSFPSAIDRITQNNPSNPGHQPRNPSSQPGNRNPGFQQSRPVRQPAGSPNVNPENEPDQPNTLQNPSVPQPPFQPNRGLSTTRRPSSHHSQGQNRPQPTRQRLPPGNNPMNPSTESADGITETQLDNARNSPGSQRESGGSPRLPGRSPVSTFRPLSQPRTTVATVSGRRPASSGNALPTLGTTTGTTDVSRRSLFQIVEEPALTIQGRPVKLTKILELFQKTGLDYLLTDPGPYTVFLPSDDAFLTLPKGVVEQLESDPDLLRQVVLFHVVANEILPSRDEQSFMVPSLQGTPILVTMFNGGRMIIISGAKAIAVTRANNGIFYVINQLLYPLPQDDIVSALSSRPDLAQLTSLVQTSELQQVLPNDKPITLFAPTDNAFSQLPAGMLQALMDNTTALRELLLGHVIEGAHYGREFLGSPSYENARGGKLKLKLVSYGYQVNDVNIKTPEIVTGNGVIHVVDGVLITPKDSLFVQRLGNAVDGVVDPSLTADGPLIGYISASPRFGSLTFSTGPTATHRETSSFGHQMITTTFQSLTSSQRSNSGLRPARFIQDIANFGQRSPGSNTGVSNFVHSAPESNINHVTTGEPATTQHGPRTFTYSVDEFSGVAQLANDIGLRRFARWITNTGLSQKIEDGGTYTVLAPTDEALNSLPPDVIGAVDADPDQVLDLLKYHILPQKLSSNSLRNDETASTLLQGRKLRFNVYHKGQVLTALGVPVERPDDDSSGSTIRLIAINQVLQPPSGNLLQVTEATPELSEFANAVKKYHLNWVLSGESGKTLFAPSNKAFQSLTTDEMKRFIDNRQEFTELLKRHLLRGTIYTTGFEDGEQRRTENSKKVTFNVYEGGGLTVNSVPIVYSDIPATNGVVHIIDQFL